MSDPRQALELWPLLGEASRADVAQRMRPGMVAMVAHQFGATDLDEVRDALEMVVAVCQAELDADEPTPMPRPNRAQRRAQRAA